MKVCYLSSTSLGQSMLEFLKKQPCTISHCTTENERIKNFEDIDYDLGISFLYTYKIPPSEFLKNKVWINFHPGPLPEYRGRNLCYHALMENAKEFGATLHYMDQEFDTGKIIKVKRFSIEPHHTAGDLSDLSKKALVDLFLDFIPQFLQGEIIEAYEQTKDSRYYKKSVINEEIELSPEQRQKIKALTFAPNHYAHSYINGEKYLILPEKELNKKKINESHQEHPTESKN